MHKIYCWYDKIDKSYMSDSIMLSKSERSVCRGYIKAFENDRKMNPAEYELVCLGEFEEFTGLLTAYKSPRNVDVKQVYSKNPEEDYKEIAPQK